MGTRYFALILGVVYTLIGLLGFVPSFLSAPPAGDPTVTLDTLYGYLLGLFPVNILHTLVHLAVGIWGILAYRSFDAARTYARVVAVVFAVLTIMGLIPGLQTTFGLIPLHSNDVWLHALTALTAGYFGSVAPRPAVTGRV
ncbi:MAG: DUF4383 domain-containing protein [Chloroflexota bacterium]|nr:MAG: DUF4383 domain-containing protein [Chloroflexota bacterium]